jgi:hypothetical protein
MAHPNEIIKKQAPNRIVLVDEAQTFTGKFYAFTPVILATSTTSFAVETNGGGGVMEYDATATPAGFVETGVNTSITMPAAVGVTVFGQFSKFTGVANCSVILYLDEQDR